MSLRSPTFAEREGAKALPSQLELRRINAETRARVWAVLHKSLLAHLRQPPRGVQILSRWAGVLKDCWIEVDHKFSDEFPSHFTRQIEFAKLKMEMEYAQFFEFIEFCVSHKDCPTEFQSNLNVELEKCGSAYRIVDKVVVPVAGEEMARAYGDAIETLDSDHTGARAHLALAAGCLTSGDYAGSIRESIHAVESVSRKISGKNTLGPALAEIEKKHGMHAALKVGFSSLYGFTSDENGIRHALLDKDKASVGEPEALYMLGSCASFAAYLVNAYRAEKE